MARVYQAGLRREPHRAREIKTDSKHRVTQGMLTWRYYERVEDSCFEPPLAEK